MPPAPNTFVSEIGKPLFEGVDLDSHLERFVLDAVDGELPPPAAPVTPPPAPRIAARPPPLKPRAPAPAPAPKQTFSLLPDLGSQRPTLHAAEAAPEKPQQPGCSPTPAPLHGASENTAQLEGASERDVAADVEHVAAQHALEAAQEAGAQARTPVPEAVMEPASREVSESDPVLRGSSEASGMIVDALPPPAPSTPSSGTRLSERAAGALDQLKKVPRDVWETGAAALLGGVIGYQASAVLMWLMG